MLLENFRYILLHTCVLPDKMWQSIPRYFVHLYRTMIHKDTKSPLKLFLLLLYIFISGRNY